jgi:putative spermidine/putrescine transport system ATP-binding protein
MGANIKLENVCKSYGYENIIKNVNIEIEKGDFLTILGPSGAGKTTLLKMIAGFEDTSEGNIYLDDDDIAKKPIHKRNIGMLFQNYALFPHMTVYENVEFPLKLRHIPKIQRKEKVNGILQKVKLEEFAKRYPRELSGGQQQRVGLARALVFNPPILLLDEPMSALDKQLRKHMQLEIKEIHNELGLTTISVTHDQEEALTMATKVCVMKDGRIEQLASPVEIYERPKSVFVAKFIGDANVLDCTVVRADTSTLDIELYEALRITLKQGDRKYTSGNHIYAVIRPEKLKLVDSSFRGIKFEVKVEQAIYVGDVLKLKVRNQYGRSLKVKVFTQYSMALSVGGNITVGVLEEDIVLVGK